MVKDGKAYFLLLASSGLGGLQVKIMDLERCDLPSTLKLAENQVMRAKFPFIDVDHHQWDLPRQDLQKLVNEIDSLNMEVLVNLSGKGFRNAEKDHIAKSLFPG